MAGAREAGRRRDRRARAPAGVPRQRPAGHHARGFRARARRRATASGRARAIVVATTHDGGYRAALDLAEAGCEIAHDRRSARRGQRRRCRRGARARGLRGGDARDHPRLARRICASLMLELHGCRTTTVRAIPEDIACDADRDERRLDAQRASFSLSRAASSLRRNRRDIVAGAASEGAGLRRRLPWRFRPCRGARGGRARAGAEAAGGAPAPAPRVEGTFASAGDARHRRPDERGGAGEGLRRFPERCQRARHEARHARGHDARSSTSSATRPPAWRPIRARPRT